MLQICCLGCIFLNRGRADRFVDKGLACTVAEVCVFRLLVSPTHTHTHLLPPVAAAAWSFWGIPTINLSQYEMKYVPAFLCCGAAFLGLPERVAASCSTWILSPCSSPSFHSRSILVYVCVCAVLARGAKWSNKLISFSRVRRALFMCLSFLSSRQQECDVVLHVFVRASCLLGEECWMPIMGKIERLQKRSAAERRRPTTGLNKNNKEAEGTLLPIDWMWPVSVWEWETAGEEGQYFHR